MVHFFCLQDVQDPSVIVNFPLVENEEVALIAWTTTPWTLPSNLALCVNPEMLYVKVKGEEKNFTHSNYGQYIILVCVACCTRT